MTFADKQAIVTGAGSGIGAALCRALADEGTHVLCTDVDGDAAERTAAALASRARSHASGRDGRRRRSRPRSTTSSTAPIAST